MAQARYRKKEYHLGFYYHVYNRGVNKDEIYLEDEDFVYYLDKLDEFKNKYKVDIIAYSLLDNHYHLLLKQLSEIPLYKHILAVSTSYGGYFNKRYKRVGPLAQDRFKHTVITDDDQFDLMSVYVNCNYEIHGLGSAEDYEWSSYKDYLGLRNSKLCNKSKIKARFKTPEKYREFCDKMIIEFQEKKMLEKWE